ncbi:hypothetical protein Tco_0468909 [Tanacetum coccineum]
MLAKATLMTLLKMFGDFQKHTPVASNVGHENLRQSCSVGSLLVNDVENRNMGLENIRLRDSTSSYYAGQKRKQLETQTRINIHIPGTRSQFGHRRGKKRIIDTDLGTHHILTEVVEAKAGTGHWLQG